MARNQLIELATTSLSDLMKEHPEHRAEVRQDLQLLNAQKMGEHEAEIERMKNVFMSILREIKDEIDTQKMPSPDINAEMFQSILASVTEKAPITLNDVLSIVTNHLSQTIEMNDNTKDLFERLFSQIITSQNQK